MEKILESLKQLKGQKFGDLSLHLAVRQAFADAGVTERVNLIRHTRNMQNLMIAYENKENGIHYIFDFGEENGVVEIKDVKIILTESQKKLINTLEHNKEMLSKYRKELFSDSCDEHWKSFDFFILDDDKNFKRLCGEENLPIPEFLVDGCDVPLIDDYDCFADYVQEEYEKKAEERSDEDNKITGYDVWVSEEEPFSVFNDLVDKIVEGCDAYLEKLYEDYK